MHAWTAAAAAAWRGSRRAAPQRGTFAANTACAAARERCPCSCGSGGQPARERRPTGARRRRRRRKRGMRAALRALWSRRCWRWCRAPAAPVFAPGCAGIGPACVERPLNGCAMPTTLRRHSISRRHLQRPRWPLHRSPLPCWQAPAPRGSGRQQTVGLAVRCAFQSRRYDPQPRSKVRDGSQSACGGGGRGYHWRRKGGGGGA